LFERERIDAWLISGRRSSNDEIIALADQRMVAATRKRRTSIVRRFIFRNNRENVCKLYANKKGFRFMHSETLVIPAPLTAQSCNWMTSVQ
jgi:hypothetical protein